MKKYWLVLLVTLMLFVPSITCYAEDDSINATVTVKRTSNLQVGLKVKDVKVLPDYSSISFNEGSLTSDIKPELVGIFTGFDYDEDEPVSLDEKTQLDDEVLLDPDISYYLVAKYDLSSIGDGSDLDTYLKSRDSLTITNESRFGENVVDMGIFKFGYDYSKSDRPGSLLLVDFKYNAEEKYLMVAGEFFVTADTLAMQESSISRVLYSSQEKITVEVEGNNLPDCSSLLVFEGDVSSKSYNEIISLQPYLTMYAYNPNDDRLYNTTYVNQQQELYLNIGDTSVSADKTKAVYTFITEDSGVKFENNKTYTLMIRLSGNRETQTWALGKGIYVLETGNSFTDTKEVLNLVYLFDENAANYCDQEIVKHFSPRLPLCLDEALETNEELYPGIFALLYQLELDTGYNLSNYKVVFNGIEAPTLNLDDPGLLDTVGELGESSKPFVYKPFDWYLASTINLNYAQDVSKENNYTATFLSPNLTDFAAPYYQWQEKSVDLFRAVDVTINVLDMDRTYNTTLGHKLIYSDVNNEYFIYGDDFLDAKEALDLEDGIIGEKSLLPPVDMPVYNSEVILYSEKLKPGDTIYIDTEEDLNLESVNGEEEFDEIITGYKYTISADDISSNAVKIKINKGWEQFHVNSFRIYNSAVNWNDVDGETSASLENPVPGKTYRCIGYTWMEEYFSYPTNEVTIEDEPKSSSSKTYKATDKEDSVAKIAGSGKKGSTRTITPIEGKKVGKVTVTDKDGNKIDVTKNADGTYSFIQPASNVNVEVSYVNREITLNIGSTEAEVDGERSNLDVCPVIRNDRTMLPIRFVAENLGAKVEWNEKNPNYVVITRGDTKIEITLGSDKMLVNGKEVKLDSVAFAENDRTYLPVRAVSENLNAIVEWNEAKPMEVKIYER